MAERRITDAEVPAWTDGWTTGYAAGIKRALADCPTHAVCPNCREGRGHYTPEHGYLPTVQSESGGLWCPECANGRRVRDPETDTYTPCPACAFTADPIGWAAAVYEVPRHLVEGARVRLPDGTVAATSDEWGYCPHCGDWCVLTVHGVNACGENR